MNTDTQNKTVYSATNKTFILLLVSDLRIHYAKGNRKFVKAKSSGDLKQMYLQGM